MNLIIGGAYQGKRDFAKETYSLTDSDIYTCRGSEIDFSRPCIDHIEEFTLVCAREGIDPITYFQAHRAAWQGSVLTEIGMEAPGFAGRPDEWSVRSIRRSRQTIA